MLQSGYGCWVKKHTDKDQAIKLDYASSYSSTANYWKNRAGTIEAIKQNGTIETKKELEKVFQDWDQKPEKQEAMEMF